MTNAETNIVTKYTPKSVGDTLDYSFNYTNWISDDDAISTSSWTVNDNTVSIAQQQVNHANTIATVWLSGGTSGTTVIVTNTIVTDNGRTKILSFKLDII